MPAEKQKNKGDVFSISKDELEARMLRKQKDQIEPCQKAVELLEAALERVLTKLGVNCEDEETIPQQQEDLGIYITPEEREEMAGLQGFFITVFRKGDFIPYAWVGAARLNHDGCCYVDIKFFQDDRLEETGGVKLVGQ